MKTKLLLNFLFLIALSTNVAQGQWTQKPDFPGGKRTAAMGFGIGAKGYVGCGFDDSGVSYNDFWEFDPATDVWTQKANFGGGGRGYGTGFSIGSKGYYGTGIVGSYQWKQDFWEYDPATNVWTQKADFGGGLRYTAVGFGIGDKGYMGTGSYRSSPYVLATYYQDFWEYNPSANTWTRKTDVPELGRTNATGISIGNKGYVGLGMYYYDTRMKDWWEYDPEETAGYGRQILKARSDMALPDSVWGTKVIWEEDLTIPTWMIFGNSIPRPTIGHKKRICREVSAGARLRSASDQTVIWVLEQIMQEE